MSPIEQKYLCVSIHDVAPQTWPDCQRLLQAVQAVAEIPVTLLVVPHYHGSHVSPASYEKMLGNLIEQGHELALHGYTHRDIGAPKAAMHTRFVRNIYTQREGEFAAIDATTARHLLDLGLSWFRQRNWPVKGFVAPAWLLSEDAWRTLREFPFEYTTTWRHFYLLPQGPRLLAPSMVYTARNTVGRSVSPRWASLLNLCLKTAPLVRLSLHPRDASYPHLVRHAQQLLSDLLVLRQATTKVFFAQQWRMHYEALSANSI